jgi:hypothetical protein
MPTQASDVKFVTVPCDAGFETTPTVVEVGLLCVPDNAGYQIEVLGVSAFCVVVPIDAGDAATGDLEWVDDSESDAVANLAAAFNFLGMTARVTNQIWRGSQILDPGDTLNMELTVVTPTTASEGMAIQVEYKILQRMAVSG